jgi:hypothetical protein
MLNFLMSRTRADGVKHEIWINPDEVVAVDFFGADIAEIFLRCDKPTYVVSHKEARDVIAFVNRYACEPPIRDKQ